ncbi:MAG: hypothetical protein F6J87_29955 [Spirulina sp. SIO3F2]|nr:hypothetical protein [Spirulina sp. SIO3F2]
MFNFKQSATAALLSVTFGFTGVAPLLFTAPSAAQRLPRISRGSIPAGTTLPTDAADEETEKILLAPKEEEPMPLTLVLAANIRDNDGRILLAKGTEIVGYLQVIEDEGAQFVAEEILVAEDRLLLEGTSEVVTTTEEVKKGADGGDILEGAAIGAGAATVISILTGDNNVSLGEILAGGAIGALGGLILGGKKVDLYSVDPNEDLDVTLSETLDL